MCLGQRKIRLQAGRRSYSVTKCPFGCHEGRFACGAKETNIPVKSTSKHTPKLHVWGAFSARGTFPLKIFRENLTGLGYIHILNECLIAQGQVLYPDGWIFQEDNDPKHTSKIAKDFMQKVEGGYSQNGLACV